MKTCEDVLDLLPDALPWIRGEALEVYDHLKVCLECADVVEETARTVEVMQNHADPAPVLSVGFADNVMAALPPAAPVAAPQRSSWGQRAAAAAVLFAAGLAVGNAHNPTVHLEPEPVVADHDIEPVVPDHDVEPVDADQAERRREGDPFGQYAAEAALVLQAVDSVETSDPEVLRLLAYHVQRTQLLDHGERLLVALRESGGAHLEPLINGTQLILRKVRHARADSASQTLWTIREEVRQTGILDAYRELLTASDHAQDTSNDPL